MGGYIIKNQQAPHFVTLTIVGWIDLFSRLEYRQLILDSIAFCQREKGLTVYAYVVMSNHMHLIISVAPPHTLSGLLRDFKKFTARKLLESIQAHPESRREWLLYLFAFFGKRNKVNRQVWQHSNTPMELASPDFILQKLNYIHYNPVRAGWVHNPQDYVFSSASNYLTGEGILEVTLLPVLDGVGWVKLF